jgi:hypothetical protein
MNMGMREALIRLGYCSKPDFMIIGAQKAGTTGLFDALGKHSRITSSSVKEVHYFDNDEWYGKGDIAEYHSFFPLPNLRWSKKFESSPFYIYHPRVAERLHAYNSDLKLIILLREPASRAFSAWTMYHHHFKKGGFSHLHDPRPFSQAISEEIENMDQENFEANRIAYVKRGIYYSQIEQYLKYFSIQQILILESSFLRMHPNDAFRRIQKFIGVPEEQLTVSSKNVRQIDESYRYKTELGELGAFYKPYNDRLYSLIGESYDW